MDSTISRAPDARFLVEHPAHFIALGFGSGLAPKAPGTFGTLVAFPICWGLLLVLPPLGVAFAAIPLFFVGVWACEITGRHLGVADHGAMVWDEIVAFLPLAALASNWVPAYAGTTTSLPAAGVVQLVVAFALFRLFDIWKPFPIHELEKQVKGGLGVMIDDVVAAFYAYVAFALFVIVGYKVFGFE